MRCRFHAALILLVGLLPVASAADPTKVVGANWSQARKFTQAFVDQHVSPASVVPTFIGKTDVFWYVTRTPEGVRYWKVDPDKRTKTPLFDHVKLLAQLSEQAQKPLDAVNFALVNASVTDDGAKLRFTFETGRYEYDLTANIIKKLGTATADPPPLTAEQLDRMSDEERQQYFDRLRQQREQQLQDEKKLDEKKDEKTDAKKEEKKDEQKKDDTKKEEGKKDDTKKKDETVEGKKGFPGKGGNPLDYKAYSPDRKKYLYAYKFNLYLAEEGKEAEAKQLTTDGEEDYGFGVGGQQSRRTDGTVEKPQPPTERKTRPSVTWSKDSKRFTATRTDRRGMKELFLVDSIAQPRPALERYRYSMPGEDGIAKDELYLGDAEAKTLTKLKPKWKDEAYSQYTFGKTSDDLEFIRRDRLRRNHEYCRLNLKTGEEKCLIAEGFQAAYLELAPPRLVEDTDEVIWWSERSGWGHFYLYDRDGKLKNPITGGEWRASRIVEVDAKNRLLYFVGNAREPGENVYYTHLYRVRFDGSDLTNLTPGNANHQITGGAPAGRGGAVPVGPIRSNLSPSRRFVVDTYSRVDLPTASVLRDDKGQVVMELEKTDTTRLEKTGWKLPECFSVKAADGMTDLFGNMWKPFDFDPNKKYPIIVYVYPGPQQEGVTHTFGAWSTYQQLAQLGFIVIQVGHRGGTPERSKAYHSFGYFNLRDYGLVDKKAAIEALAARHPWIDIDRVGIYGHSGGGFMSAAAMLQTPYNEFFKAAVASAGNHDNNIYNNYWSETYHGLKEVPFDAKKDGTGTETKGGGFGGGKGGGFGGKKKGGGGPPEEVVAAEETETLPPPRTVETPWQEKVDDIKKEIAALQKEVADKLGSGTAKQEEIDALTAKMSALVKKFDEAKKGLAKADEKKTEAKKDDTAKKVEEKKTDDKKTEEKKETPKTRFDIRIPTNAELAANLKGHLLLVHGEIDNNVHPANTMRLADALIKANKRFDLLIIPGARHGFGVAQPYFTDRMWDFFAEHLLDDRQTNADIKVREPKRK